MNLDCSSRQLTKLPDDWEYGEDMFQKNCN